MPGLTHHLTRSRSTAAAVAVAALLAHTASSAGAAAAAGPEWTLSGVGTAGTISGAAPASQGWLLVRDAKTAGQNRVSLLDDQDRITALAWPGTPPDDLEAVDAVPGRADEYLAVTSTGQAHHIRVGPSGLTVLRRLSLPRGAAVEGLALVPAGGTTVAVWASRGSTTKPGKLLAATVDLTTWSFGPIDTAQVTVPFPTTDVRHVSDLEVVGTRLVVSSASDPGARGPFDSALYDVGTVALSGGRARLTTTTPVTLGTFPGHKVEAVACSNGTGLLGSDDEKLGGWIRTASFCG